MIKTEVAEIFQKLEGEKRTETAKLRDIFEHVNDALNRGIKQEEVLIELHKIGFSFTIDGFRYSLKRIRSERGLLKSKKNIPPSAATPVPTPPPSTPSPTPKPAARPAADIDKQSLISMEGMVKPMGGFKPQKP